LVHVNPIASKQDTRVGVEYLVFGQALLTLNLKLNSNDLYGVDIGNPCVKAHLILSKVIHTISRLARNQKERNILNKGEHYKTLKVNKGSHWVSF
jgi:hypothetical protein